MLDKALLDRITRDTSDGVLVLDRKGEIVKDFQVVYADGQLKLVKKQKMNELKDKDEPDKQEIVQDQSAKAPKTGISESHTDVRIIFVLIVLTIAGLSIVLIKRRTDKTKA